MAPVPLVLHRLSSSNETLRNAPKPEFSVQWSGSGAVVTKNFDATSFSELALMSLVRQVLHRLLCSNETVWNTPKHEFWD
jgi:hypothetical protein